VTGTLEARPVRSGVADGWIVAGAVAAAAGAYLSVTVSPGVAVAVVAVVSVRSIRVAAVLGCLLIAGTLADRSIAGLTPPDHRDIAGMVSLVSDPEWVGGAVRVDVRFDGRRYETWARGSAAYVIEDMLSGETVTVTGGVAPFDDEWLPRRARHVVGQLDIESARGPQRASGLAGVANSLRRSLVRGAFSLSQRDRVLLSGFSVGDDRQQLPQVTDDFRAAGLTHLTAVSGQNVAFVLLLIGPLLRNLGPRGRVIVTTLILVQFGLITRWEPSVMRAVAMAMAASVGQLFEGKMSGIRALGLVVIALILIDPMLVHSVGFTLSVMASVGIALWSTRLANRLPGPRWVREPLALTLSAQAAVAPILVTTFGSMPVVSVPANMAAGPVSGPLMVWGLVVGPVAGLMPAGLATVVHVPTRVLAGYVAGVARIAAGTRAPSLDLVMLIVVVTSVAVGLAIGRHFRWLLPVVAIVFVWAYAPGDGFDVRGANLVGSEGQTVLVIDQPSAERLLSGVRRARVDRIDAVVMASSSSRARAALAALQTRHVVGLVVAARPVDGAVRIRETTEIEIGRVIVTLSPRGSRLDVEFAATGPSP